MHVSQTSNHCIFSENGLRFHLRVSIFQNFSGGACPQTPLALACYACYACRLCFAQYLLNSPLETAQKGPTPIMYGPIPLQPWTLCPGNDF